jgi:hypothetical protein
MEQILARLLAEMNAMEERTGANLREIKAEIRINREAGAPTTLWNFCPQPSEKDAGGTSGPARTLSGNHSGRATLRREQLERNPRENRTTRKEG